MLYLAVAQESHTHTFPAVRLLQKLADRTKPWWEVGQHKEHKYVAVGDLGIVVGLHDCTRLGPYFKLKRTADMESHSRHTNIQEAFFSEARNLPSHRKFITAFCTSFPCQVSPARLWRFSRDGPAWLSRSSSWLKKLRGFRSFWGLLFRVLKCNSKSFTAAGPKEALNRYLDAPESETRFGRKDFDADLMWASLCSSYSAGFLLNPDSIKFESLGVLQQSLPSGDKARVPLRRNRNSYWMSIG